jgi:hypothetical protein
LRGQHRVQPPCVRGEAKVYADPPGAAKYNGLVPRPLQVLTAVSALLFVTAAALSVRARWAMDQLFLSAPPAADRPLAIRNEMYALTVEWDPTQQPWFPTRIWHQRRLRSDGRFTSNRASADLAVPGFRFVYGEANVAHWLVSLLTLPLPVLALFKWVHRSKRYARGRCVTCGYDLRASSDRCPECGASLATPGPERSEGPDGAGPLSVVSGPS